MAAYLIANVEVTNPEDYREYVTRNTAIVQRFGGRFVVRGGKAEVLEGEWTTYRVVVIEFPDGDTARAWYNSPEYQEAAQIRRKNARTHLLAIVESA